MGQHNRLVRIISLVVVLACMVLSAPLSNAISSEAGRSQLVYADTQTEGDPPEVALGVAMGAFRGLFVNYLWLRANRLKEEGKFYEAMELSSAITKLQPRFPRVWAFHAWNMAYNISVATNTPEERWQWVQAGVRLLRDEGIPKNPNDLLVHKELAWIFVHKIQGYMDDANRYYKRQLAEEWSEVLGQPPLLPDSDTPGAIKIMTDWLRPVVDAPSSLDALIAKDLEDARAKLLVGEDPNSVKSKVAELVTRIKTESHLPRDKELGIDLLRFVLMHNAFKGSWYGDSKTLNLKEGVLNSSIDALLDDPQYADAWKRLLPFVRRQLLVDSYHMEPDRMLRYTEKFGPLDWRHPGAHAVYWSQRGVEESRDRISDTSFDTLNTDRVTSHALQELWRSGTIIYDPITTEYTTLNNMHYTDIYGQFLEEDLWPRQFARQGGMRAYELNNEGYENFLRDVIRVYFRMGRKDKAQEYFRKLRLAPWKNQNNNAKVDELGELDLEAFVRKQMAEDRLSIPQVAASEVMMSLRDAYYRGLLRGDMQLFKTNYEYAAIVHKVYFEEKQKVRPTIDAEAARMDEMPRDFLDAASAAFLTLLVSSDVEPINASAIYRRAPEQIQQRCFDALSRFMVPNAMPREQFIKLFPEPPNMEAYREMRRQQEEAGEIGKKRQLQIEKQ